MGYTKIIKYSNILEIYQYAENPRSNGRKPSNNENPLGDQVLVVPRKNDPSQEAISLQKKRTDNARRLSMAFRRIISANLEESVNPVFASLTYAEHITDPREGRKDFNAFARTLRYRFGGQIRYIAVPEFQKSGRLHFHALLWGLPTGMVESERSTRLVASLWQQGFADIKETDGNLKLSAYLSKYMAKAFDDPRLFAKKAYICSRNVLRPVVEKRAIVIATIYEHELSTVTPVLERTFLTQWMGEGRFRLFDLRPQNERISVKVDPS